MPTVMRICRPKKFSPLPLVLVYFFGAAFSASFVLPFAPNLNKAAFTPSL